MKILFKPTVLHYMDQIHSTFSKIINVEMNFKLKITKKSAFKYLLSVIYKNSPDLVSEKITGKLT